MSVRRPYIRAGRLIYKSGRVIYLIRPEPVRHPSLAEQLLRMLLCPSQGVGAVLRANPNLWLIGFSVLYAGLLAALLEGAWQHGGPFLLLRLLAILTLWLSIACLLQLAGRLLGGQGSVRTFLQVTGIALCLLPMSSLLERVHAGAGLMVGLAWLLPVGYQAERQAHGLAPGKALAAALVPVLALLGWWLASAGLLFQLIRLP